MKLKFQISITKLQINLKLQYPMTKTSTEVVSYRFMAPRLPVMIPIGTSACFSLVPPVTSPVVSNFEIGSLGFVCNLFFGA